MAVQVFKHIGSSISHRSAHIASTLDPASSVLSDACAVACCCLCLCCVLALCLLQDPDFPSLSGALVVRIAEHPQLSGAGYGSWALDQLKRFFRESNRNKSLGPVPPALVWPFDKLLLLLLGAGVSQLVIVSCMDLGRGLRSTKSTLGG